MCEERCGRWGSIAKRALQGFNSAQAHGVPWIRRRIPAQEGRTTPVQPEIAVGGRQKARSAPHSRHVISLRNRRSGTVSRGGVQIAVTSSRPPHSRRYGAVGCECRPCSCAGGVATPVSHCSRTYIPGAPLRPCPQELIDAVAYAGSSSPLMPAREGRSGTLFS